MESGQTTSKALVGEYLKRIEIFDQGGTGPNAMISINPRALEDAAGMGSDTCGSITRPAGLTEDGLPVGLEHLAKPFVEGRRSQGPCDAHRLKQGKPV